ncbi:unnamed protein product [Lymnaea stagnalis]|uniref:SEFIR domain-containing protein n=1 Tax=Lymnaea stagnalis TaxID=6523 RepID=A0AAV2I5L8_LYMST
MGTSTELKRGVGIIKGDKTISWMYVPETVRQELIIKLNPDSIISGNDWRMLAFNLGFTQAVISFIESEKDTNTSCLFKMYDQRPDASLNEIYKFLEEMERTDCLEIIDRAYPEIYKKATEQSNQGAMFSLESSDQRHPGRYPWATTACSHSSYPSLSSPPVCMSHTHCTCHFPSCPVMTSRGHQAGMPPSNYHYQTQTVHPNTGCNGMKHSPMHEQVCNGNFSPMSSPPHSAKFCCGSPHMQIMNSSPPGVLQCPQTFSDNQAYGHSGRSNFNSGYHSETMNSMLPETDLSCSSLLHSVNNNNENGTAAMAKFAHRTQVPLPNNICVSDSGMDGTVAGRQKMARQYSDECNESQGLVGDKRLKQSNGCSIGDAADHQEFLSQSSDDSAMSNPGSFAMHKHHGVFADHNNKQFAHKGVHMPGTSKPSGQDGTSLVHLKSMAEFPDKYKPTNEYKRVVAEQKIDTEKKKRSDKDSLDSQSSSSSNGSSAGRPRPSSTFPLRVKAKHERPVEEITASLTISKKSASMPQNMKPVEYRKAFRNTKVFVTYSYDDENHGKQVLSLCKFLQSNGFACCVDVTEKPPSSGRECVEWCRKRITEADFILVCVSPKYIQDISNKVPPKVTQGNGRHLHAWEIFDFMKNEYFDNLRHCAATNGQGVQPSRLVPLLFGGMQADALPQWMTRNRPSYIWPKEYLDLAWMLTNPQERIKSRRQGAEEGAENQHACPVNVMSQGRDNFYKDKTLCCS